MQVLTKALEDDEDRSILDVQSTRRGRHAENGPRLQRCKTSPRPHPKVLLRWSQVRSATPQRAAVLADWLGFHLEI